MYKTVDESYKGQSVFVTGCTGFLGKALLEKLLYSCPGLDKVYVLIRDKKNVSMHQRITKILEQPVFSRLKAEQPYVFEKIVPISGDISEPNLGIKADDEKLLLDKVSIVFHVAAAVKYNEPFEVHMNVNVMGTKRALELSKRMKNIKAFVHVSTAYATSTDKVIKEEIYPAPASLNEIKKLLEIGITKEQIKELTGDRPNMYAFSKALSENIVADNHGRVPSVIIRPSIVSSSKREPVVGWLDNWYGASSLLITVTKGVNRVLLTRSTNILDLIPVDYVTNLMIVAAVSCKSSKDVLVYNSSTSAENPVTFGNLKKIVFPENDKRKYYDIVTPSVHFTQYKWVVTLLTLMFQIIPAFIMDVFLLLTGKTTRYMKIQAKVALVRSNLEYFTSRSWIIRSSKTKALFDSLAPSDKEKFPFNPADIDWNEYIPTYIKGIKQFLMKM